MSVRNCRDIGINLQNIVKRLLANQDLCKLLYYTDKDPLNQPDITEQIKKDEIYQKLLKITPRLDPQETAKSTISVMCISGSRLGDNSEFKNVVIRVEVFVPMTQWIIKDTNLRPYAILGEVQESLNQKVVNGLGKLVGGDFDYDFGTDEMTAFSQIFQIVDYD